MVYRQHCLLYCEKKSLIQRVIEIPHLGTIFQQAAYIELLNSLFPHSRSFLPVHVMLSEAKHLYDYLRDPSLSLTICKVTWFTLNSMKAACFEKIHPRD